MKKKSKNDNKIDDENEEVMIEKNRRNRETNKTRK